MRTTTAPPPPMHGGYPPTMPPRSRYQQPPEESIRTIGLLDLLRGVREVPTAQRSRLYTTKKLFEEDEQPDSGATLWYVGNLDLVKRPCVAIVGSRKVSKAGLNRAARLSRELVDAGVVVVSGLAAGVDQAAHRAALEAGGSTIAVIGTGVTKAYPAAHGDLQEKIYREHLLISPFAPGSSVFSSNFPHRNKIMAAISDATVVVEAGETSGTVHQAAECRPDRLNRWLFFMKSLIEQPDICWPKSFLDSAKHGARVKVLETTQDVIDVLDVAARPKPE